MTYKLWCGIRLIGEYNSPEERQAEIVRQNSTMLGSWEPLPLWTEDVE